MKRMKLFLVLTGIAALLLATMPASAKTSRTPLDITEYVCMNTPGKEWVGGNVYHLRGQIHKAVEVVNGEVWGFTTATLDLDWNLKTGQVTVWGFADLMPTGVDGGYAGAGAFRFYGSGPNSFMGNWAAQGYGDLKGQFLRMDAVGEDFLPVQGAAYCEGRGEYFSTTLWSGYILNTDS
jgi:hypothetical protein